MDRTVSGALDGDELLRLAPPPLGDYFLAAIEDSRWYRRSLLAGAFLVVLCLVVVSRNLQPYSFSPPEVETVAIELPSVVEPRPEIPVKRMSSAEQMMQVLKTSSLWEMPPDPVIQPIVIANFPLDFGRLDIETQKRAFLHALLPAALLARAEVEEEREILDRILARYQAPEQMVLSPEDPSWQEPLAVDEIEFVELLAEKYRSARVGDLLARVDSLPVSLIMAQAALESSWGSSRFARKGNNLFGLWTWSESGLVPSDREEGKSHKIAVYDSILCSTRAYLLNINRLPAYRELRQLRQQTRDPLLLANGLVLYSARGEAYVSELKSIIRHNQLDRYDQYSLAEEPPLGSISAVRGSQLML